MLFLNSVLWNFIQTWPRIGHLCNRVWGDLWPCTASSVPSGHQVPGAPKLKWVVPITCMFWQEPKDGHDQALHPQSHWTRLTWNLKFEHVYNWYQAHWIFFFSVSANALFLAANSPGRDINVEETLRQNLARPDDAVWNSNTQAVSDYNSHELFPNPAKIKNISKHTVLSSDNCEADAKSTMMSSSSGSDLDVEMKDRMLQCIVDSSWDVVTCIHIKHGHQMKSN